MEQSRIDWPSFCACVAIIVVVCIPLAASPDAAGMFLQSLYDYIAIEFGIGHLPYSQALGYGQRLQEVADFSG